MVDHENQSAELRKQVLARYAGAAAAVQGGAPNAELLVEESCCGDENEKRRFGAGLYDLADAEGLPVQAMEASLGCGNPTAVAEMFRVLAPGGRIGVSDVVAEDHLSPEQRAERGSYVGCIAGALSESEYLEGLEAVGFTEVSVTFTHEAADGMHAAIIRATKPAA